MSIDTILLFGTALLASGNLALGVTLVLRKPKPEPATISPRAIVSQTQPAPTAQVMTINPTQPIVKCAKCNHFVARYTQTPEGPVCANELPIV
jgi:hypothetical protein